MWSRRWATLPEVRPRRPLGLLFPALLLLPGLVSPVAAAIPEPDLARPPSSEVGESFRLPFKLTFSSQSAGARPSMRVVEGEIDCVLDKLEGSPGNQTAKLYCRYRAKNSTRELKEEVTVDMDMIVSRAHGYVIENTVYLSFKEDYSNGLQVGLGVSIKTSLQNQDELSFTEN